MRAADLHAGAAREDGFIREGDETPDLGMSFELTGAQRALQEEVTRFAREELASDLVRRDAEGEFSRELWQRCADAGILGLLVPEEFGGRGADLVSVLAAVEGLGYGCADNGLAFAVGAHLWACTLPILHFGSTEQKRRYLPGLCDGRLIGANAATEPASGSDIFSTATRAEPDGEGFVLRGEKAYITNAPVAGLLLVLATTDTELGSAGLAIFLVERQEPGLSVRGPVRKMGVRTAPMGEVVFDGVRVGAGQILGPPGAGMAIFNTLITWERACIMAGAVGTMRRQLERTIARARARRQFRQPIGRFQAVAHRIVEMKLRLETSRLLLYRVGWQLQRGERATLESALTKLHIGESFLASSLDAVQLHGAYGYLTDNEIERDVRDAIAGRIYSGTSEIQRNIVAACLGL
ncbi:MAG: acyl-CoA dehydrogenase family protein [Actinomycetota bacterium]